MASANDVINNQTILNLNSIDADSVRSIRTILCQEARVSQWMRPPLTADQQTLLDNETQAATLRAQVVPPAAPTLAQAKTDRISQLRQQGQAYIQLGFIFQSFTWGCRYVFDIVYLTLAGYQTAGNLLTGDGKLHLWDAGGVERLLTPLNASKLAGALYQWLYLAQAEYQKCVTDVNALTTVAAVQAYRWTTVYSTTNLWNGDTWKPPTVTAQQLPA